MARLEKRQQRILTALDKLGGRATVRDIAKKLGSDSDSSIAQSLEALSPSVYYVGGQGANAIWSFN